MTATANAEATRKERLFAFDRAGNVLAEMILDRNSMAIAGTLGRGTHHLPEMGSTLLLLTRSATGFQGVYEEGERREQIALEPGAPLVLGSLTWLLLSGPETDEQDTSLAADAMSRWIRWAAAPMNDQASLLAGLREFLEILVARAGAVGATFLLYDEAGTRLIAHQGMSAEDAEKMAARLPQAITQEILKNDSRLILPEDMEQRANHVDSTLFIKGVESAAGFPVTAEGRVLALLLVAFRNLVVELSAALEAEIQGAAGIAALVIQRALLREQLETRRLWVPEQGPEQRLMLGQSRAVDHLYHQLYKLAPSRVPILIQGETGSGKELAARELHRLSERAEGPFVAVNAAALPESLIESELFGHRKGAFTGAIADRKGLIEQADGGTLFVDEIGELPLSLQPKLLRVLQEKTVQRVGDNRTRPVDFRLVTATHRDLKAMVHGKTFREDFYFRIAGAEIAIPPLRQRREDILLLARFFLKRFCRAHQMPDKELSREAMDLLVAHDWPGNVRELENAVERAAIMADGPVIKVDDFGNLRRGDEPESSLLASDDLNAAKDAWMRFHISRVLAKHGGNKRRTAEALGIGLRTLFRHIETLGIRDGG